MLREYPDVMNVEQVSEALHLCKALVYQLLKSNAEIIHRKISISQHHVERNSYMNPHNVVLIVLQVCLLTHH